MLYFWAIIKCGERSFFSWKWKKKEHQKSHHHRLCREESQAQSSLLPFLGVGTEADEERCLQLICGVKSNKNPTTGLSVPQDALSLPQDLLGPVLVLVPSQRRGAAIQFINLISFCYNQNCQNRHLTINPETDSQQATPGKSWKVLNISQYLWSWISHLPWTVRCPLSDKRKWVVGKWVRVLKITHKCTCAYKKWHEEVKGREYKEIWQQVGVRCS